MKKKRDKKSNIKENSFTRSVYQISIDNFLKHSATDCKNVMRKEGF